MCGLLLAVQKKVWMPIKGVDRCLQFEHVAVVVVVPCTIEGDRHKPSLAPILGLSPVSFKHFQGVERLYTHTPTHTTQTLVNITIFLSPCHFIITLPSTTGLWVFASLFFVSDVVLLFSKILYPSYVLIFLYITYDLFSPHSMQFINWLLILPSPPLSDGILCLPFPLPPQIVCLGLHQVGLFCLLSCTSQASAACSLSSFNGSVIVCDDVTDGKPQFSAFLSLSLSLSLALLSDWIVCHNNNIVVSSQHYVEEHQQQL